MSASLSLAEFMERSEKLVLLDVRSEGEYGQGHFPGSLNLPLLNNEERKIVGTTYKQQGREAAVEKGFELVGHKFSEYIRRARELAPGKEVALYCWRGGMRSGTMSWLLNLAGFKVVLLKGGYKVFRNWALEQLKEEREIIVLGGKTCSGKTEVLRQLNEAGEQVIDLEELAHHKGSAFGALGQQPQPSNEQFENLLALKWAKFSGQKSVWLENESNRIGTVKIPDAVFGCMRRARVLELMLPLEKRIARVLEEYGQFPKEELEKATRRLERRLGNLRMRQAVELLQNGNVEGWAKMMLEYYDDSYAYSNSKREKGTIREIEIENHTPEEIAKKLLVEKEKA